MTMNDNDKPFELDVAEVKRSFNRAARDYDTHAPLQREVRERLLEKLDLVTLQAKVVLDAGCGPGGALKPLAKHFPKAELLALDIAPAMLAEARRQKPWFRKLKTLEGDLADMPLADDSVDVVFSNLALQWVNEPDDAFAEFRRVLRGGGLLVFSTFGPDTLRELRDAWSVVDGYTHVNRFLDLHDVGDALVRAGFTEVVMDVEHFTLTYDNARDLLRDLKIIGAHNVNAGRARGLTGRKRFNAFEQAYEKFRVDGRLPATYEVVYGTAWLPEMPKGVRYVRDGSVSVEDLRRSLKERK
ncbi:MAG TPA: malonyl-ACP O-methyltransferase BioC [Gammaproteobacteria bacterium]